jgi:hypothetical protein
METVGVRGNISSLCISEGFATPAQQAQDKQTIDSPGEKMKVETAELSNSGIQQLCPQQRAAPNDLGGASGMRQETNKLVQLDSRCSSNISQHGSFLLKDQITARTETGGMDPSTTTESRDVLTRSGDTTGTKSNKKLLLPNVNSECDDNVLYAHLPEISKPAIENTSVESGKGNGKQSGTILHTSSPLRRSVRLNNTNLLTEFLQQMRIHYKGR